MPEPTPADADANPDTDAESVTAPGYEPQRRPTARITALAVGAVMAGLIAVLALADPGTDAAESNLLGLRTPDVSGPTLDGGTYDIDSRRGNWVVVNFFATWCAGCVNEHPELVAFDRWARQRGDAELVAVVFNDPVDRVEEFFALNGGGWPVLDNSSTAVGFQVAQIPETFLVDPSGRVVMRAQGEVLAEDLIALIEGAS